MINDETGHSRDYQHDPYWEYEASSNPATLYAHAPIDVRHMPKKPVLGIPPTVYDGEVIGGAVAFPFAPLDNGDSIRAVHHRAAGIPVVVFWDRDAQAATAFRPSYGASNVVFEARGDMIVDMDTESRWTLEGVAVSGELAGERLAVVAEAYVSFWFARATFVPSTEIWGS